MPCDPLKDQAGRPIGWACSRGGRKPKPCAYCNAASSRLCDYPKPDGPQGTCSRPLCDRCTTVVGKDTDMCRLHAPLWKDAGAR